MHHVWYAYWFTDIILNPDYELKQVNEQVIQSIDSTTVHERFDSVRAKRKAKGQKGSKGKQAIMNSMF